MDELTYSDLLYAIEENRFQAFSTLGSAPGGSLIADGKIIKVIPPIQLQVPLCAWVFDAQFSPASAGEEVEGVVAYFEQRNTPFIWETGPSSRPKNLESVLPERGMAHLFDLGGMALDLNELKDPDRPKGLVTARVDSRDKLRAWANAFGGGFGLPKGSQAGIVELIGAAWEESGGKWRHYVGTLDGDPVGSSSMYLERGVAGLYFVGTVPAARQRGIGTWMTSLPLKEARELGVRLSVLHAAPKAQPLYRRLGFKEYCKLGLYCPSFMDWTGFPPEKP